MEKEDDLRAAKSERLQRAGCGKEAKGGKRCGKAAE